MNLSLQKVLHPLIPFLLVVLGAEWGVRSGLIPPYLFAAPSAVWGVFIDRENTEIWTAFGQTLGASLAGFLVSVFFGVLIGVLFSSSQWLRLSIYPYTTFFQTVPIIAIAPILVIWFGYGFVSVLVATVIVAIFPVIASTLSGLQSTDPALLDLFHLYRVSGLKTLFKLRLPFALPQLLVGFRIASGLSVIGVLVGEFIAGGGLGGLIDVARARQEMELMFGAVFLGAIIGLLLLLLVNLLSKILLSHWHPSEY